MAIRHELRAFILNTFYAPHDLGDDASLMGTGTIDSTGTLEIITYLEEKYAIQVLDAEIHEDNFDSLRRIDGYVTRKLRGTTRPDASI